MTDKPKMGATGEYPDGTLGPHDEGQLQFGIASDGKLVHINFGKPVEWFAGPPENMRPIALEILRHAWRIDGKTAKVEVDGIEHNFH